MTFPRNLILSIGILLFLIDGVSPAADGQKPASPSPVTAPPEALRKTWRLSPFYKKHVSVQGLPILGSAKVSDSALREAADIVEHMLAGRDDVRAALIKNRVRVAVMAPSEMTTDLPEHSDLTPKDYWDKRARGLGATTARPAVSCGEENLLNLPGDRYPRENILVHEFAHTFHEMGLNHTEPGFDALLRSIYDRAIAKGLWKNTYAATDHKEYWAEGVQSYFDTNDANNRVHNHIDTREKLARYDPDLYGLIDKTFHKSKWRYERYDRRQKAVPQTGKH